MAVSFWIMLILKYCCKFRESLNKKIVISEKGKPTVWKEGFLFHVLCSKALKRLSLLLRRSY